MARRDPSVGWARLLVRLPEKTTDAVEAEVQLRDRVNQQLGPLDSSGEPWVLEELFENAVESELRRCWQVSGAVPAVPTYDSSRLAYDLAAMLARDSGLEVEPDVPSTAFGLEPTEAAGTLPLPESAGDTAGTHLAGSDAKTWSLDAVRARDAWKLTPPIGGRSRGEGVLIGHIDTGYTDHPDLERAALALDLDWDVLANDDDARDPLERRWFMRLDSPGHGTHTGSVIASRTRGLILGAAPMATLVPFRAVKSVVQVLDGDVARAVDIARDRGCHIVSMSLGGRGFFGLRDAIRAASADGMIVMAAAGNKVNVVVAPASYPECIAVAATNAASRPWPGSSRGRAVDIAAPGESVWAASVDSSVRPARFLRTRHHGTSFAVATLAGVAALWLAHHGRDRIVEHYGRAHVQRAFLGLVRSHGHRVPRGWRENGWDRAFGVGIVDALALLRAGLPDLPEVEPEALAAPIALDPVGRLQAVLGDLTRDQVRDAVGRLLDVNSEEVNRLSATVVSELVYRLGEDDQLRDGLLAAAAGAGPESAGPTALAPRQLLARTASMALMGQWQERREVSGPPA